MSSIFIGESNNTESEDNSQIICAKHEEVAALIDGLSENVYSFKATIFAGNFQWKQDKKTRWVVSYQECYRNDQFKLTLFKKNKWFFGWRQYEVPELYLQNFKTSFINVIHDEARFKKIQSNIEANKKLLKAIKE